MSGFAPWEIPTGGKPPELRLAYGHDLGTGRRYVVNGSAWLLLIRRASGVIDPLPRTAGWLSDGDEVLPPAPHTEPVDGKVLFSTQSRCLREYHEGLGALADADADNAVEGDDWARRRTRADYRWWWYKRELPHGRVIHLQPASLNARLTISIVDGVGPEGTWCYPTHNDGWRAALGWNGEGDPPDGWSRHLDTGRRRKDGTPATEYRQARDVPLAERRAMRGGRA